MDLSPRILMAPDAGAEAGGGAAVSESSEPHYAEDPSWAAAEEASTESSQGKTAADAAETGGVDSAADVTADPSRQGTGGDGTATGQPAAPQYDQNLLRRAQAVGLTADEIVPLLDKPEALTVLVANTERYWQRVRQWQEQQAQSQQQQGQQTQAQRFFEQRKQALIQAGWEENDALLQTLDDMDRHYSGQFQQYGQAVAQHIQNLAGQVAYLQQQHQRQGYAELERVVDDFFDTTGDEWEGVFGKGGWRQLPPGSPLSLNRYRVTEAATKLLNGTQPTTENVRAALKKALYAEFGDQQQSLVTQKVRDQARDAAGRFTSRPTNNGSQEPGSAEEQALAFNREWLKKHGLK